MSGARLEVLAAELRLEPGFLTLCVAHGVVAEEDLPEDPSAIPADRLARLRRLDRLCRGLDLDVYAGAIIVDLLERLERLERDLGRGAGR